MHAMSISSANAFLGRAERNCAVTINLLHGSSLPEVVISGICFTGSFSIDDGASWSDASQGKGYIKPSFKLIFKDIFAVS